MHDFLTKIKERNLLTDFIKDIFGYSNINDYNYTYELNIHDNIIIIDIFDKINNNRFNRYMFSFDKGNYDIKVINEDNIIITKIYINNLKDSNNLLYKFAYMFKLNNNDIVNYANTFLNKKYVEILEEIINKPIHI